MRPHPYEMKSISNEDVIQNKLHLALLIEAHYRKAALTITLSHDFDPPGRTWI